MPFPPSPEDRPDSIENMPAMRARIPDHVARGEVSTGVIVVTGAMEYVLDFVRNLPRPNLIVARVVLPHMVMPQFIEALATNVELFRQRYGELPGAPAPIVTQPIVPPSVSPTDETTVQDTSSSFLDHPVTEQPLGGAASSSSPSSIPSSGGAASGANDPNARNPPNDPSAANNSAVRRQNPQEVYDDLKLRDEILSGAYANAVMIGHGPYEFSFDFITNFYPQSAVSCRVYLASGHILRLLDSLKASWEQLRPRLGTPPSNPPQPPPPPSSR